METPDRKAHWGHIVHSSGPEARSRRTANGLAVYRAARSRVVILRHASRVTRREHAVGWSGKSMNMLGHRDE